MTDHNITAIFAIDQYTITVEQTSNGTITPETIKVNYGGNQTFTFTPDQDYKIKEILIDNVKIDPVSSYTFTEVTKGHTITALFETKNGIDEKFDSLNKIFAFGKDINIQLDSFSEMTLEILDLTGKVIKTKSILDLQTTIKVEKSGIYIVRLLSKDNKVLDVQKVLCN